MIVLYDYLLFALELAGILYFMRGLPLRGDGRIGGGAAAFSQCSFDGYAAATCFKKRS